MITSGDGSGCMQCGEVTKLCSDCDRCDDHCNCGHDLFDADELGLDPETDNTPLSGDRNA